MTTFSGRTLDIRRVGGLKSVGTDADDKGVKPRSSLSGRVVWFVAGAAVAIVDLLTFGPLGGSTWERPDFLFSLVTVVAATCVIAATVVIALADRREMAEIGLLGSALMATSVLPLVHGLVTPGVLYGDNDAFGTSMFLALPVAVAVASPLLARNTAFGRWAARHWRDWTLLSLLGVFVIAAVVVFFPDVVTTPTPHSPLTITVAFAMVAALVVLSRRQLRLYELGRRPANLVASISLLFLSSTALLPIVATPYSAAFWWLHLGGALGVLGACAGMLVSKKMSASARDILEPLLSRDPLVAFELGLSPIVHRFVADLERKDQITRDHVIRTGELAMRVGERMRLSGRDLRNLGLAAMLHDVGKLWTPGDILMKPARLTPEEYDVIKRHPADGEQMLASEPSLADAAGIVRAHHERVDGRGYPDGLVGDEIPLASRIIAVCDALDAMTHDRPYRTALSLRMAFAVLREHAGSQWDPEVVQQVIATMPTLSVVARLDAVGRDTEASIDAMEMPADISEILATVDAEI